MAGSRGLRGRERNSVVVVGERGTEDGFVMWKAAMGWVLDSEAATGMAMVRAAKEEIWFAILGPRRKGCGGGLCNKWTPNRCYNRPCLQRRLLL
ncbi:hypothetical protein L484_019805 [Morus notabilis]|uniref:Uncharacterized protein n=1 Tax=Morus notabilis TaxID=981085 RepID=W9RTM5_9ROSA|nr:hypothetical protein L484_019805 [Morus notabilis]